MKTRYLYSKMLCFNMVIVFTTTDAISTYHYWCCEFESRSGRGVQHYVIKFVTDLRKIGVFLQVFRFPNKKTGHHDITEIVLKVALNTITQRNKQYALWEKMTDITVFSKWKEQTIPRFSIIVFSICDQDVRYWRTYQ
jgi:hypothetical protein